MNKKVLVPLGLAFLALGALTGTLVALSAQSLAQSLMAALFALFGGSILIMLEKLNDQNQLSAAVGILMISIGALGGIYSGVYVSEYQLLTPRHLRGSNGAEETGAVQRKYLRENVLKTAEAVDVQYRNRMLTAEEAYEELRKALTKD